MSAWLLWSTLALAQGQGQGMSAEQRDAQPLPRYTSASAVRDVLAAQGWSRCQAVPGGEADQILELRFRLTGSGQAEEVVVQGAVSAAVADCVAEVLRAAPWPPHDEVPLEVVWVLGMRGGALIPYPTVQLPVREVQPLFLFVPPDASPEQRAVLMQALGLTPGGGEAAPPVPVQEDGEGR